MIVSDETLRSMIAAGKIVAKGRRIAAHLMEAGEHDIEFERGRFVVAGTDRAVDLTQVARAAFMPARLPPKTEPGLFETGTFAGGERTYPNGCHFSEVEVWRGDGTACARGQVVVTVFGERPGVGGPIPAGTGSV